MSDLENPEIDKGLKMKKAKRNNNFTLFTMIVLFIIIILITPRAIEAKKDPGKFSCFRISVPKHWIPVNMGPGEWYYQSTIRNGAGIWLMLHVHEYDPGRSAAKTKKIKKTGTPGNTAERLTGGKPVRTESGVIWDCYEGYFQSGRDHITYSVTIPGAGGMALTSACIIVGSKSFTKGKSWSLKDADSLRNILSSLRITKKLKKCRSQKKGAVLRIPPVLAKLALAGKRGFIGADLTNPPPARYKKKIPKNMKNYMLKPTGASVHKINQNSPLIKAGVQDGDWIWKVDSQIIHNVQHMIKVLYWKNEGEIIRLHINRNGKSIIAGVKLAGYKELQTKPDIKPVKTGVNLDSFLKNNNTQKSSKPAETEVNKITSLKIHNIRIEPASVQGGGKFVFIVDLTLNDPIQKNSELEIEMEHEILKNGNILYTGKVEKIYIPNGRSYQLNKKLNASKKTGMYKIRVSLNYKEIKKTISGTFKIY